GLVTAIRAGSTRIVADGGDPIHPRDSVDLIVPAAGQMALYPALSSMSIGETQTVIVPIVLDPGSRIDRIGSGQIQLYWDQSAWDCVSLTAAAIPGIVVGESNIANGQLTFSFASASGYGGIITLGTLQLQGHVGSASQYPSWIGAFTN